MSGYYDRNKIKKTREGFLDRSAKKSFSNIIKNAKKSVYELLDKKEKKKKG